MVHLQNKANESELNEQNGNNKHIVVIDNLRKPSCIKWTIVCNSDLFVVGETKDDQSNYPLPAQTRR